MRLVALVSSDHMQTAGIFQVDDSIKDADLLTESSPFGFTVDFTTYATGAPYIDAVINTLVEFRNYVSTVQDPATE